jgi:mannose-6-phosphate isomerase-like protein (cupin superfamily)
MIKRNADMQKEVREKMREGTGSVEILHVFRKGELGGRTRLFARLRIPRGSSIGYHEHHGEEEVFFILSGRGLVNDNGVSTPVGPGDAVLTGAGTGHAIECTGDEPLELMAVILPY